MRRILLVLALAAAPVAAFGFGGTAQAGDPRLATPAEAELSGGTNGDPDGTGRVTMKLYPTKNKICYVMTVESIQVPATAAHLHREASRPKARDRVVLDLHAPQDVGDAGRYHECIRGLEEEFIRRIKRNTPEYYVAVHNEDDAFEGPALRGDLVRLPKETATRP